MTWCHFRNLSLLLLFVAVVSSCSSDRNNFLSKGYHNTTARYNAYFLAELRMEDVEKKLQAAHEDDYNKILSIYPKVTPAMSTSVGSQLEDIVKKSSLPITRHKNSKWVDNSYIIIGKARRYSLDYPEAVSTFKYVNTKSEDLDDRHDALINLMITFMETNEMDNATAVVDYLNKEEIAKKNKAGFYKAKGEYFYRLDEYEKAAISLRFAIQYVKDNVERARLQFIVAQLYQEIGMENRAYVHYNLTLKNNPPYELSFFAKLYLAQTYQSARGDDIKKIRKYFEKLLKDEKNVDYKDKIYYEMAKFDLKQGLTQQSLADLRKSLNESKGNTIQQGYSYLMSGEVYYDKMQNYNLAKLYYDSAVSVLPKDHEGYKDISRRQKILTEFVKHYQVVQTEDSLQRMAAMGKEKLTAMLDAKFLAEQEKEEEERKEQVREERRKANLEANRKNDAPFAGGSELPSINMPGQSSFYFSNAKAVSKGKKDFERLWGDRPLEDNWRRSKKQQTFDDVGETAAMAANESVDGADLDEDKAGSVEAAEDLQSTMASARQNMIKDYLSKVPFTKQQIDASNDKLKVALYNLGKLYDQQLNEPKNAIITFEDLIGRFPDYEKNAEVLYFLYVLYGKQNSAKANLYKNRLLNEYPDSDFARVILNPNYFEEQRALNARAKVLYKDAYILSEEGFYSRSNELADDVLRNYSESDFEDQLMLLKALNIGKSGDIAGFKEELIAFIKDYPKSELIPFAEQMLKNTNDFLHRRLTGETAPGKSDTLNIAATPVYNKDNFSTSFSKPHYYIVAISNPEVDVNQLKIKFSDFSRINFSTKTQNLIIFNDVYQFLTIRQFKDKEEATLFLSKAGSSAGPLGNIPQSDYQAFVISDENYGKLLPLRSLDSYMQFYRSVYSK